MIRFDAVTKRYPGGTTAVDDLTLEAPTGQITVLVGPSGCGKTTSLRMVNRMIEPTSGRISIDDTDTASMDPASLRRGIGYVIQHGGLFPHHTIERNVATVPLLLGTDKKTAYARAHELLERVGLPREFAQRYPAQLSGGQQQRVGVARALAADPPVMLMDEPFSAVDPVVRAQLQEEFKRLQSDLGKTILFVTHDIDEAITLGDQVAVMRVGGRLAQIASPSELLAHPADDFVADFVGRDRGYRALSFVDGSVPLVPEASVRPGDPGEVARERSVDGWVLVADGGQPLGWLAVDRVGAQVDIADLALGGTLARQGGPLRAALDAALSSPSGRGVVVGDQGELLGTVRARDVIDVIEGSRGGSGVQDTPAPGVLP
ncbi:MAG: ATP-binding cassette domain-containing protein [Actinobacteria bacterium]|nr:ATP-binding cassette domain-containing protein [Actinomycetota bacterium]